VDPHAPVDRVLKQMEAMLERIAARCGSDSSATGARSRLSFQKRRHTTRVTGWTARVAVRPPRSLRTNRKERGHSCPLPTPHKHPPGRQECRRSTKNPDRGAGFSSSILIRLPFSYPLRSQASLILRSPRLLRSALLLSSLNCGQDRAEPYEGDPAGRLAAVVAVRRPAVERVVAPTAAPKHAVRA